MTEQESENLLEQETRMLIMPDGKGRYVSGFKIVWNSYDMILRTGCMSAAKIVDISWRHTIREGGSFEESFERVVGYTHRKLRDL